MAWLKNRSISDPIAALFLLGLLTALLISGGLFAFNTLNVAQIGIGYVIGAVILVAAIAWLAIHFGQRILTILKITAALLILIVTWLFAKIFIAGQHEVGYIIGLTVLTTLVTGWSILLFSQQRMRLFIERVYNLPSQEAKELLHLLIFGTPMLPPKKPTILVSEGRIDPDGPETLRKVGGPGFVAIRPDSGAVTCRGGYLHRVLGPGFHELEPFERIWGTIDLRRQKRRITVEAITRDCIPITVEADIFFRAADKSYDDKEPTHYFFDPEIVLRLATLQLSLDNKHDPPVKYWHQIIVGQAEGVVRNKVESMCLNDLCGKQSHATLTALSREIELLVQEIVSPWGVKIEAVRISAIKPGDRTISKLWVQHWQLTWEQRIRSWDSIAKVNSLQTIKLAQTTAEFKLLSETINAWKELLDKQASREILAQLLQTRFMDVLHSMAREDPLVKMTVLEQAETLQALRAASMQTAPPEENSNSEKPSSPADET